MNLQDTITNIEQSLAEIQATLARLKEPALTKQGWASMTYQGKQPNHKLAPRHGCEWNTKESRDLVTKWLQFSSLETLAQVHGRTLGGVRSQLQHLLYSANLDVLLDEIVGTE